MTARNTASVTVQFAKEKETKNTVRYDEIVPDDTTAQVRTLYLVKDSAAALGNPDKLSVVITAA